MEGLTPGIIGARLPIMDFREGYCDMCDGAFRCIAACPTGALTAFDPYVEGEITQQEFFDRAKLPLKRFMLRNAEIGTVQMYCEMAGETPPTTVEELEESVDLPMLVIAPAFVTSELKAAFWIGFLLYIPFMLIDVIVSSTLMSMGMIMLPPSMISTPFKILLFILLDGWSLLFSTLIQTVK